jgi:hypothetical protein
MTKIALRVLAEADDNDPMCCAFICPRLSHIYQNENVTTGMCGASKASVIASSDGRFFRTKECLEQEVKPEIINSKTLVSDDLAYRVAFGSICEASKDPIKEYDLEDRENIRLEFYLNGIRTDILPFFKRVDENFDNQVNQAARDLVKEKFVTLSDLFYRIERVVLEEFPNIDED